MIPVMLPRLNKTYFSLQYYQNEENIIDKVVSITKQRARLRAAHGWTVDKKREKAKAGAERINYLHNAIDKKRRRVTDKQDISYSIKQSILKICTARFIQLKVPPFVSYSHTPTLPPFKSEPFQLCYQCTSPSPFPHILLHHNTLSFLCQYGLHFQILW